MYSSNTPRCQRPIFNAMGVSIPIIILIMCLCDIFTPSTPSANIRLDLGLMLPLAIVNSIFLIVAFWIISKDKVQDKME